MVSAHFTTSRAPWDLLAGSSSCCISSCSSISSSSTSNSSKSCSNSNDSKRILVIEVLD